MTQIQDLIIEYNPWWREQFRINYKPRLIYSTVEKFLSYNQIIALTGLRRVGKTTLLYKLAEKRLKEGFDPTHIFYFSFDEYRDIRLLDLIKEYQLLTKIPSLRSGKFLFLFDEVQKLSDWENQLKVVYDLYMSNVKIVISGSESLFIKRKAKETLAGRLLTFKVDQLSFYEYLLFKDFPVEKYQLYKDEVKILFKKYMISQGFPEIVDIEDREFVKRYLDESIVEKVVYYDIPSSYGIDRSDKLEMIMKILMNNPGQIVELNSFAGEIGLSRQTLSLYFEYLENAFLIRRLFNFSKNYAKSRRKLKKYYPAIYSVELSFKEDSLSLSKIFESTMVRLLDAEYFWRDPYKNEVDVVLVEDGKILPVEIKFGKGDIKSLLRFMEKFGVSEGMVITFDEGREEIYGDKKIKFIEGWKWDVERWDV